MLRLAELGADFFSAGKNVHTVWVVPCNTRLVHGAGLAKAAAQQWATFARWRPDTCFQEGSVHRAVLVDGGEVWAAFTKDYWRNGSQVACVERIVAQLNAMAGEVIKGHRLLEIRLPKLGCGLGGLKWADVEPLYQRYLADSDFDYIIY